MDIPPPSTTPFFCRPTSEKDREAERLGRRAIAKCSRCWREEGGRVGFRLFRAEKRQSQETGAGGVRAAIEAAGFHSLFILLCRRRRPSGIPPSAFMKNSLGNAVLQFYKLPMEYFSFVRGCDLNFFSFQVHFSTDFALSSLFSNDIFSMAYS